MYLQLLQLISQCHSGLCKLSLHNLCLGLLECLVLIPSLVCQHIASTLELGTLSLHVLALELSSSLLVLPLLSKIKLEVLACHVNN